MPLRLHADLQYSEKEKVRKAGMSGLTHKSAAQRVNYSTFFSEKSRTNPTISLYLSKVTMGIGSVWLGAWPQTNLVKAQSMQFNLPETLIPNSIIAFGDPAAESTKEKMIREEERVHYEKG